MPIEPADLMLLAIDACREGIALGQSPCGCAIALGGQVVAVRHNTVLCDCDVTAHAEINALRAASQQLNSALLTDAVVATTCEP